uniref:RING-type E3 ubiquitin transferase n=1 Tax=Oryza punctata TaxID=4537 RepID=A0A0E0LA49_ORYPU
MTPQDIVAGFAIFAVMIVVVLLAMLLSCRDDDEPEFQLPHGESEATRAVYAAAIAAMTTRRAGTAARRPMATVIAEVMASIRAREGAAAATTVVHWPLPATTTLPYFPYALGEESSETQTLVCAICLEQLRHGELCSEVPACRHVFHRDCLGAWIKSNNTCPMCRVEITRGSNLVTVADDMV